VDRYALTQPQTRRGTETITAAVLTQIIQQRAINHKAHKGHKDRTKDYWAIKNWITFARPL